MNRRRKLKNTSRRGRGEKGIKEKGIRDRGEKRKTFGATLCSRALQEAAHKSRKIKLRNAAVSYSVTRRKSILLLEGDLGAGDIQRPRLHLLDKLGRGGSFGGE